MMHDIQEVLAEKQRELRIVQQWVACLRLVAPLLLEEGEKPPEGMEPTKDLRQWP